MDDHAQAKNTFALVVTRFSTDSFFSDRAHELFEADHRFASVMLNLHGGDYIVRSHSTQEDAELHMEHELHTDDTTPFYIVDLTNGDIHDVIRSVRMGDVTNEVYLVDPPSPQRRAVAANFERLLDAVGAQESREYTCGLLDEDDWYAAVSEDRATRSVYTVYTAPTQEQALQLLQDDQEESRPLYIVELLTGKLYSVENTLQRAYDPAAELKDIGDSTVIAFH